MTDVAIYMRLNSPSGFREAVAEYEASNGVTRKAAYDAVNASFAKLSGRDRYSSYETFVQLANRDIRAKNGARNKK